MTGESPNNQGRSGATWAMQLSRGRELAVAGYKLFTGTRQELLESLTSCLGEDRQGLAYIVTLNPELAQIGYRDSRYRGILLSASVATCDGVGVQLAALVLRRRKVARICGSDLIYDLAMFAQDAKIGVLLVGAAPNVNSAAVLALRNRYPALRVQGLAPSVDIDGQLCFDELAQFEACLHDFRPGIVLACLGSPKQERFLWTYREIMIRAGVKVVAGLGGTLDFVSGRVPRAPLILRKLGLEWIYRVANDAGRLRRLVRNTIPYFASALKYRNHPPLVVDRVDNGPTSA